MQEFLTENWTNADVQEAVKELRDQYVNDVTDKVEGAVAISDGKVKKKPKSISPHSLTKLCNRFDKQDKEKAEQIAEIVANVKWQISIDRKTTSLKKLQGLIWAKGYNSGAIKGQ